MRPSLRRAGAAFLVLFLLGHYFWRFTHVSLETGFNQDDLMNLYFAWREPLSEVLKANLFFRTPIVRPFGALFYAAGFQLWGYEGFPFRLVCYAVLCLNVVVTYVFVRRFTNCGEVALIAVLLHCVHSCYFPLYYGSGSCYDVFAFFFYYVAFALTLGARNAGRLLTAWECVGVAVLFTFAVNSKEAAASLPAMLFIYEALRNPPRSITWIWREGRASLVTSCVSLVFLWARFTGPNNLLSHPGYSPVFSLSRYLECTAHYLNQLSAHELWRPETAGMLLAGMAVLAAIARSRQLWFAWSLVVVGAAPMAFVSPRGLAAYYIPVLGYALYAAILLVRSREFIARTVPQIPRFAWQAGVFLALFLTLWRWQEKTERRFPDHWTDLERIVTSARQFQSHPEWFGPNKSLLITSDPFGEYEWASTFIAAVVGNERSVSIQKRRKLDPIPTPEQLASYNHVIGYEDGKYVELAARPAP